MAIASPHPNDDGFAPVRGDFTRLLMQNRDKLALGDVSDAFIVENVTTIVLALMTAGVTAQARGDTVVLDKLRWFSEAMERQFKDERAVPLDA